MDAEERDIQHRKLWLGGLGLLLFTSIGAILVKIGVDIIAWLQVIAAK